MYISCFLRRLLTRPEPQVVNFGFGKASFEAIKRMGYNASFSVYRCVHLSLASCLLRRGLTFSRDESPCPSSEL